MSEEMTRQDLGMPVEVGEIDHALAQLWEADDARTKASLMNLLVYTEEPGDLLKNARMVQELTREHACRAVLIAMDRVASEARIEAWVTAHCHLAHGKKSICSEQIAFLLHGKALGRMRNTVFAHLNSDLPLVFWWQGEFSSLFEERLYRLLNRLIFDSADWRDPVAGFDRLEEARKDTKDKLVTQDLSWTRSYFYRLALARLFDDPTAQRAFPEIRTVRVAGQPKHRTAVLQMVAWVITRAGWSVGSVQGDRWALKSSEGKEVEVELTWDDEAAPIAEIEMISPDCRLGVRRAKGNPHLCQWISGGGHEIEMSGPADADEQQGLVASQLSRGGKNSLFLTILPLFRELLAGRG